MAETFRALTSESGCGWYSLASMTPLSYLRRTPLYDAYLMVSNRKGLRDRKAEVAFYRQFIKRDSLVFDAGANAGHKTDIFLRCGGRVIAIEPGKDSLKTLRQRFGGHPKVTIVPVAISDRQGTATFYQCTNSAYSSCSESWVRSLQDVGRPEGKFTFAGAREVPTQTLDSMIAEYGQPEFIKLDVEGYELQALKGLSHAVPSVSIEVNFPNDRENAIESIKRISGLGTGRRAD